MSADSTRVGIRYRPETVWGEAPPNPCVMQALRHTGSQFMRDKKTGTSNELRTDRNVSSIIELGVDASATLNIELSAISYNDLFEAVLCGTYQTVALTGMTLAFNSGA